MAEPIIMPKYEMSQEIGTIVEWTKKDGDPVKKGETILVVETDKVTMDVECPATGIIAGIRGEPGESIPVTEIIGYVLKPGETLPESKAPEEKQTPTGESKAAEATPVAKRMAEEAGLDVAKIQGTGPGGKVTKTDVENALVEEKASVVEETGKLRATPAARRIARENEIDLSSVTGSGPRDRVQAADVLNAAAAAPSPARVIRQAGETIPFSGMRKKIADRMVVSYQTAPACLYDDQSGYVCISGISQPLECTGGKGRHSPFLGNGITGESGKLGIVAQSYFEQCVDRRQY